ncbi:TPA: Rrf2 family transcriptional regulator [Candidatus Bipolaricaulota bacterium]|nr:Rrf2 family transcriptional regulator [Candidatus Bipolaricaulota bacterium]
MKRSCYPIMFGKAAKYAVMALVELAAQGNGRPMPIRTLAAASHVPQPFLAKLVPQLVRAGIISSTRGKRGGIAFARPPEEISLAQVLRAVEGERLFTDCPFTTAPCGGNADCPLAPLWDTVRDEVVGFLECTSLARVAKLKEGRHE